MLDRVGTGNGGPLSIARLGAAIRAPACAPHENLQIYPASDQHNRLIEKDRIAWGTWGALAVV
jgi:hypothetical protein